MCPAFESFLVMMRKSGSSFFNNFVRKNPRFSSHNMAIYQRPFSNSIKVNSSSTYFLQPSWQPTQLHDLRQLSRQVLLMVKVLKIAFSEDKTQGLTNVQFVFNNGCGMNTVGMKPTQIVDVKHGERLENIEFGTY